VKSKSGIKNIKKPRASAYKNSPKISR